MDQPNRRTEDKLTPPLRDIGADILRAAGYIFDGIRICLFVLVFICWLFVASSARLFGFVLDTRSYFIVALVVAVGATFFSIRLVLSWRKHGLGKADGR